MKISISSSIILAFLAFPGSAYAARIPIVDGPWWLTILVIVVVLAAIYFGRALLNAVVSRLFGLVGIKMASDEDDDEEEDEEAK